MTARRKRDVSSGNHDAGEIISPIRNAIWTSTSMRFGGRGRGKGNAVVGVIFLTLFGLLWTSIVSVADAGFAYRLAAQTRTYWYATTTGWITSSTIETRQSDDSTSYLPKIEYRYRVGERDYQGNRLTHGEDPGSRARAEALCKQYAVGKELPIFYDPAEPSRSVLATGLNGNDLIIPLFLIPFNAVAFAFLAIAYVAVRRRLAPPLAGGAKIIDDGFQTRVRLEGTAAWVVAVLAAAGTSFVAIFAVLIPFQSHPPLWAAALAWAVVLGVCFYAYARQARRLADGARQLVIDTSRRTLTLPATEGRTATWDVPWRCVQQVEVYESTSSDSDGDVTRRYAPTLVLDDFEPPNATATAHGDAYAGGRDKEAVDEGLFGRTSRRATSLDEHREEDVNGEDTDEAVEEKVDGDSADDHRAAERSSPARPRNVTLVHWSDEAAARAFATWLREQIGLRAHDL